MIKLKQILQESLLLELSGNSTLYHRTTTEMKPGDKITPKVDQSGQHWLADKKFELAMESYRQEYAPDKPSRLNCVFSSVIPRSRFVDKGYLYVIKPIGKMMIADSRIIDDGAERFDREYYGESTYRIEDTERRYKETKDPSIFRQYLQGTGNWYFSENSVNHGTPIEDIEILSEGAIVIEKVIGGSPRLKIGDEVKVTESGKITAWVDLYFNSDTYKDKENMSEDEIQQFVNNVAKTLFVDGKPEKPYGAWQIHGILKKGARLKIIHLQSMINVQKDLRSRGKYETMTFDFYFHGKLIHRDATENKKNIFHRFTIASYLNRDIDFAKYLRKI